MEQFKVGQTYMTRSIGDHNCIISARIIKRTEKTVTADVNGEIKTFRPSVYRDAESILPWGNGSMMPIINATDTKVLRRDWEQSSEVTA